MALGLQPATRQSLVARPYPRGRLLGAVAIGATLPHPANGVVGFTVISLPASSNIGVSVRVQTQDSNRWIVRIDASGNLTLTETVASSDTQRGSSATAVSANSRVVIVMDGSTITIYVNGVSKIVYASAANFATASLAKLNGLGLTTPGVVADMRSWELSARQMEGV